MISTTKHWHSTGHTLVLTRGSVTVSVEAPITGLYTDARVWMGLLRSAIELLECRLVVEENKRRV